MKTYNPAWYSFFDGPNNIEQLAKYLKLHASYEILYRGLSSNVHATSIIEKKIIPNGDGSTGIVQIRYPEEAQSLTNNTANILIMAFLTFYKVRLSERNKEFSDWYLEFRKSHQELSKGNMLKIEG